MTREQEIEKIKQRNRRVELEKAWETSLTRKVSISILTYVFFVVFFHVFGFSYPLRDAAVPTLAFLLSTASLSAVKRIWLSRRKD